MKSVFRSFQSLSSLFVLLATAAVSGEPTPPPPEKPKPVEEVPVQAPVVVTASRIPTETEKTGVSITVIDGKENKEVLQNIQFSESLRPTPGITVSRSGAMGDFTTVFTRGGNSNQTLFLFDGWKVNRQGGNFNLSALDPVQIDRIEIARGPASSLFGTDAVTGVINVLTAQGEGRPLLTVSGAIGTYQTDRETLSIQGREKKFSYNVTAAHLRRPEATYNNSKLETYNYAGRFDFDLTKEHHLKLILRGSDQHKGYYEDSGTGYGPIVEPVDPNDQIKQRDFLGGFEYRGEILPLWETKLRLGYYLYDQRNISEAPNPDSSAGFPQSVGRTFAQERRPSLDWQNDVTVFKTEDGKIHDVISVGTTVEGESFNQDDTQFFNNQRVQRTNYSLYFQNRIELYERAFVTAGVRHENNGQFGDFTTARGDVSILIPESNSRIHGSVGNAFRAPSFFEAYSSIGNRDLQPEKNFAYDVGIDQHFWKKRITVGATWFNNDFRDMIDFNVATSAFDNLKRANSNGLEAFAEIKPIKIITIRGTAYFLHTEDDVGNQLKRRPNETYTAQVIANPIEGLDVAVEYLRTGSRKDIGPLPENPFATVHSDAYNRVDASISYRFLKHWRAFARIENVLDESYEESKTFPSPGSNTMGGIEFNWRF